MKQFFFSLFAAAAVFVAASSALGGTLRVYLGTYTTSGVSKGIYVSTLDTATGALTPPELAAEMTSPSFLAISPDGKNLYAVAESGGPTGGAVTAYGIDPTKPQLTMIGAQSTHGQGPCHVSVDPKGTTILVANYGSGSCASYPREADGAIGAASGKFQHTGSGPDPARQKGPHAHMILPSPDGKYAYVPDLGLDQIMIYQLDGKGGMSANAAPFSKTKPAGGPRHLAFHPSKPYAWIINEMASSITTLAWDAASGNLTPSKDISTLPSDFTGKSSCAHVECHPGGNFVYGSNRGHDSIAVFSVLMNGWLKSVGQVPSGGKTPRNFGITPDGKWLLAANQGSDSVNVFKINDETGKPEPTSHSITVGSPVCVKFLSQP